MEPAVVRRAGPGDLIAYTWYELGYRPQQSLILIALHGNRFRAGMISRCDLPDPPLKRSLLAEQVRAAARPLVARGASAVMAMICTGDVLRRPEPPLVRVLVKELPRLGLEVRDVLGVTDRAYRSLLCDDEACCPPAGHSLDGVLHTATAVMQVVAGRVIASSEEDLVADVRPVSLAEPGSPVQATEPAATGLDASPADASRDLSGLGDPGSSNPGDPDAGESKRLEWWYWWRDELARQCEASSEPDERIKIFWWVLDDVLLRDAVMLHAIGASAAECEALVRRIDGGPGWAGWDHALTAAGRQLPGDTRVGVARSLLVSAARHARPGRRAPVLAMLAWVAWFEGNGVRARLLVQQALDDRPGYSLALIVEEILLAGAAPPWVALRAVASDG